MRASTNSDSELDTDRKAMLQLLSIRGQRVLNLSELTFLLHALGALTDNLPSFVVLPDARGLPLLLAHRAHPLAEHSGEAELPGRLEQALIDRLAPQPRPRPSVRATRSPSGDAARPAVVTNRSRRAPTAKRARSPPRCWHWHYPNCSTG